MSTDSQTSTQTDLEAFYSFVGQSLKQGEKDAVPEAVLEKWRAEREHDAVCDDIRQGIADMDAGLGIPLAEVAEKIRRKYGIPNS
jgi:predicted transcriptional regulator